MIFLDDPGKIRFYTFLTFLDWNALKTREIPYENYKNVWWLIFSKLFVPKLLLLYFLISSIPAAPREENGTSSRKCILKEPKNHENIHLKLKQSFELGKKLGNSTGAIAIEIDLL